MKVLVTGAAGFLGRRLTARLVANGDQVVGLDAFECAQLPGASAIRGDLSEKAVRADALGSGCDVLVHLATIPGGAAEVDPAMARRINLDATYDLLLEASELTPGLRVVFASSIAVFGDKMPPLVDDQTPVSPVLVYGGHKAMVEQAIVTFSNRGMIEGLSLRLPGIVARPRGASGMKSAFLSELFHSLKAGERFVCPVSPEGTVWIQSVEQCAENVLRAIGVSRDLLGATRAVTLPAIRTSVSDLVLEISRQCSVDPDLVSYAPEPLLEAAFAAMPQLHTPSAQLAGFARERDLTELVRSALQATAESSPPAGIL